MNYHLNFKRLFTEERSIKLNQQIQYVTNIVEIIAPTNAFAMYFLGYLQSRLYNKIDSELIVRLEDTLRNSEYWSDRFFEFSLSSSHLSANYFPQRSDNKFDPVHSIERHPAGGEVLN